MAERSAPPSTIGQVRDVFPKLGELTDKVVFGDVWERPGPRQARPQPDHGRGAGGARAVPTRSAATSGARSTTA